MLPVLCSRFRCSIVSILTLVKDCIGHLCCHWQDVLSLAALFLSNQRQRVQPSNQWYMYIFVSVNNTWDQLVNGDTPDLIAMHRLRSDPRVHSRTVKLILATLFVSYIMGYLAYTSKKNSKPVMRPIFYRRLRLSTIGAIFTDGFLKTPSLEIIFL